MFRKLMYLPVVAVCAFSLMTAGAEAGKKKNLAIGIAVGVAATALAIAAAQSANAHRNREYYGYNHGVGPKENAVGACIHRADRRIRRHPNGRFARLDHVKKVKRRDGRLKVTMLVTNVFAHRSRQRWVKCHVKHDRVVFFKYN